MGWCFFCVEKQRKTAGKGEVIIGDTFLKEGIEID